MNKKIALIVDDEDDIRALAAISLQRMGLECYVAANIHEAHMKLSERHFHFCITDMKLPDGNGLELIEYCQQHFPAMPIAMITAYGNLELGINALKAGAFDVVSKPIDTERLRNLAQEALRLSQVPVSLAAPIAGANLTGESSIMLELKEQILKVSRTQAPVFISGEAGSGKNLTAQLIHQQSTRSNQSFVIASCSGRNEAEIDKLLFGAQSPADGLLCAAHLGTLFLDDVDQLPLATQAKLLRALQEKMLWDNSHEKNYPVDFRVLSSSEKDLQQLVKNHEFRQDLFFRLNVIPINIPPLRAHKDDIPLLTTQLLHHYCSIWSMPTLSIEPEALAALIAYDFPGNVSELEAILQRAVTMAEGDSITLNDLYIHSDTDDLMPAIQGRIETNNLEQYLENIERRAITLALESTRWNKTLAAQKLGISFRTLRYRCKKLGID